MIRHTARRAVLRDRDQRDGMEGVRKRSRHMVANHKISLVTSIAVINVTLNKCIYFNNQSTRTASGLLQVVVKSE